MKNLLLLSGLFVLLSAGSCKKEVQEKANDNVNTLEVKKNGQLWPGTKIEGNLVDDHQLTIFLYGENEEYIAINFTQPTQTGNISGFSAGYISLLGGDVIIDEYHLDTAKPYQLEITSFNAETKQISGRFSFTLKRSDWFTQSLGADSNKFIGQFNTSYNTIYTNN